MTSHDLYAIYAGAYAESSHFESGRLHDAPAGLARRLRRFLTVERTIEELARHDATDGRPMRTRTDFELALREGRRVLPGLLAALGAET
ncbi:MAG: hypothetical protein WCS72_08000 [Deltaproteobacteria bacterium]